MCDTQTPLSPKPWIKVQDVDELICTLHVIALHQVCPVYQDQCSHEQHRSDFK